MFNHRDTEYAEIYFPFLNREKPIEEINQHTMNKTFLYLELINYMSSYNTDVNKKSGYYEEMNNSFRSVPPDRNEIRTSLCSLRLRGEK